MQSKNNQAIELSRHIMAFLEDYAPTHLTNSKHTLQSYESALTLYIGFLESKCNIKMLDFGYQCFENSYIEKWLKWLAEDRNCSPATCNNRLSSIRTFIKYLASRNIKYQYLMLEADKVPLRKAIKSKVSGLTRDAVKAILEEPDGKTKSGIRDLTFLVVLYATAARVDEILSLKISNVQLNTERPNVTIIGKGNTIRTIYLLPKAEKHLRQYIEIFHGLKPQPDSYIFYSRIKGTKEKMSQSAVRKMLHKYATIAHEKCAEVPLDLHAHQFRHAKASHWLEDGMNIVQISLLLGHAHLQTTMIYLDITTDQERVALATLEDESDKKEPQKWNSKTDSLSELCRLRWLHQ